MNLFKKNPALFFGLALTILFLLASLVRVEFFDTLGLKFYDASMKLRSDPSTFETVAIVDIDDESIEKLGRWPWPRSLVAQGIDKIAEGNPALIGLNIIYSEPEENTGLAEIARLKEIFVNTFIGEKPEILEGVEPAPGAAQDRRYENNETGEENKGGSGPVASFLGELDLAQKRLDHDSVLAASISRSGKVILPIFFKDTMVPGAGPSGPPDETLARQAIGNVRMIQGGGCPTSYDAVLPIPPFRSAAAGMGHINVAPDQDGSYRRERLVYRYRNLFLPSYALLLATRYMGKTPDDLAVTVGSSVEIPGIMSIPTTPYTEMLIGFNTYEKAFRHYSFFDVINDKIPPRVFDGKIVLVSLSAKGLATPLSTPMGPSTAFGDFTASILRSILNRQFITELPLGRLAELASILLLGLVIMLVLPRLKASVAGGLFTLLLVSMVGGSIYLIAARGVWADPTYPLLFLVTGYTGIVSIRYFVTEAGKRKVEGESAETNRMLGISFQSQGMLDMAFDKFRKVPVDDEMKDLLYNLALDYERKRQLNKAAAVYEYIEKHDKEFKDVSTRKEKLLVASETMVFGAGLLGGQKDNILGGTDPSLRPTLGRYEIIKQLGKGAMGVVYLGQDPKINRMTAIKTVRFEEDFDEEEAAEMKKKFFREAESAGTLSHPNIVTIYDAGEEQDIAYIAMEYLEGDNLEKYAKKGGLLPIRELVGYIADIAEGLDYAHRQGIVHRDIKPANIMLLKDRKVKITDFGIARITAASQTKTGIVKGTPYYMSPEQISGKKVDGRSDIFSLGVMTFQLLTGTVPFKGSSPAALMHKILNDPHPDPRSINPKIPKALVSILNKALEKDPSKRYQTAGEMAAHLRMLKKKMDEAFEKMKRQKQGN